MNGHPDFDAGLDADRHIGRLHHLRAGRDTALCGLAGLPGRDLIDERDLAYSAIAETTCRRCLRAAREQLEAA